jgi:hypothetical protein
MGAVVIGDVFYMFTGTYPIYAKLNDDDELTFYVFSIDLPTSNELVVTGHNLLEEDFDNAYFSTTSTVGSNTVLSLPANFDFTKDTVIKPLKQQITPRIPFVKDNNNAVSDGAIGFKSSFEYIGSLLTGKYNTNNEYYYEMDLISSGYRFSGPGATTLDFTTINPNEVIFEPISNYNPSANLNLFVEPEVKVSDKVQTSAALATVLATKDYTVSAVDFPYAKLKCGFEIEVTRDFVIDNKDKKLYYSFLRKKDDLDATEVRYSFDDMDLVGNMEARVAAGETLSNTETGVYNDTTFRTTTGGYAWNDKRAIFTPFTTDSNGTTTYFTNSAVETDDIEISNKNYIIDIPDGIEFENITGFKIEFYQIIITYDDVNTNLYQNVFSRENTLKTKTVDLTNATSVTVNDVFLRTGIETEVRFSPASISGSDISDILIGGVSANPTGRLFTVPPGYNGTQDIEIQFTNATTFAGTVSIVEEFESNIQYSSKALTTFPSQVTYDDPDQGGSANLTDIVKLKETLGFAQSLPTNTNYFESAPFTATVRNLISGLYDFIFRMNITKYELKDGFLAIAETNAFDFFFPDVNITPEKLDDYEFFQDDDGNEKHPIWSCNKVIEHYNKLMVWGSQEMKNSLFYSFPDRPTYFPSYFYLNFGRDENDPIEAVTPFMNILVAQTKNQTWGVRGNSGLIDSPAPYTPFGINSTVGTVSYKSVRPVRNHLFFLSKQGIIALKSLYAADEQYNIEFVDRNIRNIVPQDSDAVGIQFDNQYWLNFPNNSITLRWYINKKAWVKDVYQGWATDGFNGVFKYQIVDGKLEYITYPSTLLGENQNEAIYRIAVDYDLPTDLYQSIKAKFETAFLNQNYPFHPKNYKEAKLDFTLQNEYNKGRLAIFDSSSGASVTYAAQSISFTLGEGIKLEKNHRYRVDFFLNAETNSETGVTTYSPVNVTNIQIEGQSSYVHDDISLNTNDNTVIATEFMLTNDEIATSGNVDIVFTHDSASTANPSAGSYVTLRDVTYDDTLTFDTYIISEDQTLNFNNYSGYDQASVDIGVDLTAKERLGDWTFGTSDFGKKVTAVKTIKLSGKGYNAKLYLEDTSKSKWTLESMGITYKMKRARSR